MPAGGIDGPTEGPRSPTKDGMAAEVVLGGAVAGGAAFAEAVPDAVADDTAAVTTATGPVLVSSTLSTSPSSVASLLSSPSSSELLLYSTSPSMVGQKGKSSFAFNPHLMTTPPRAIFSLLDLP